MPIGGDVTVTDRFLAIDWGTTNRRVYLLDASGTVHETFRDDRGVLAVGQGGFADEVAAIRAKLGDWPVIAAGMVGSQRGWAMVPYLSCPRARQRLPERCMKWRRAPGSCRACQTRAAM
jgi:2-dehydro-3-deoxygalactonokinase